ncbi:MAG: mannitol dehydrogenase family protein, partial [Rhizobiales bacterium]|nr:mannitol dehydrogenase family protein [Hyphomicrobiales bacterium]
PQDGLYTVVARDSDADACRVIGAIGRLMVAPEDPEALVAAMADPAIRIVSLTVTEKGYARGACGGLDEDHPDIRHDLASPDMPRSTLGFLAAALDRRRRAGLPPFAVLTCDNLPSNGVTLKTLLARFAELRAPALGDFVREHVRCPSTMVDRIVPAPTDADRALVATALGVEDAWPVVTEPYFSWVIEDDFPLGRPDFQTQGIRLVGDVAPFEAMKLRLLNGAHSTMAYAGLLLGHETVAEAFADPDIRRLVERLWREAAATLAADDLDPDDYCRRLATRFYNRAPGRESRRRPDRQGGSDGDRALAGGIGAARARRLRLHRSATGQPCRDRRRSGRRCGRTTGADAAGTGRRGRAGRGCDPRPRPRRRPARRDPRRVMDAAAPPVTHPVPFVLSPAGRVSSRVRD